MYFFSFITDLYAQTNQAQPQQPSILGLLLPFILVFVIMYFFIILPQKKEQKKIEEMRNSLKKGDRIVTIGGIFGTIKDVRDDSLQIEIAPNVLITITKNAVARKLEKK